MRMMILAALLCAMVPDSAALAERPSACAFAVSREIARGEIAGNSDAAARASVMTQPDSPLAILRADLSGAELNAAPGSFFESGRYVLDVRNVSDQVITDARVLVQVAFGPGSGVGSGTRLGRPLQPGEHVRLEWKSAPGRGTDGAGRDPFVVVLVEEVRTARCTYKPSQAWPR